MCPGKNVNAAGRYTFILIYIISVVKGVGMVKLSSYEAVIEAETALSYLFPYLKVYMSQNNDITPYLLFQLDKALVAINIEKMRELHSPHLMPQL